MKIEDKQKLLNVVLDKLSKKYKLSEVDFFTYPYHLKINIDGIGYIITPSTMSVGRIDGDVAIHDAKHIEKDLK
jgi:hypothetical protein